MIRLQNRRHAIGRRSLGDRDAQRCVHSASYALNVRNYPPATQRTHRRLIAHTSPLSAPLLSMAFLATTLGAQFAFAAGATELCMYEDASRKVVQVTGRESVPEPQRGSAKCFAAHERGAATPQSVSSAAKLPLIDPRRGRQSLVQTDRPYLAQPDEIQLKGSVREEQLSSPLGRINLRWPRSAEVLFGRTPSRAMTDAAQTIRRTLSRSGFPPELQGLRVEWNVVFMDADLPESQIPSYLIGACHPAWMTPPANLYIVAQRVASGCSGQRKPERASVSDAALTQVLLHEMGHAIEYQLLVAKDVRSIPLMASDRARAEGFATWFEAYSAELSAIIPPGSVFRQQQTLAASYLGTQPGPFVFKGSADDYAVASMAFHAIEKRRGVRGIVRVYQAMQSSGLTFPQAVEQEMRWDREDLAREIGVVAGLKKKSR